MHRIAIVALVALSGLAVPARAELVVNISTSQQRLSVSIDGTEAFRWPVSTGTRGHATPNGIFRPQRLERHWYSRQYSLTPMPWAMFFHRGYAVHGTMETYNLGRAASHGCVRLRPDNAATLYSIVRRYGPEQTRFVVMAGPLPELAPPPLPQTPLPPVRPSPAVVTELSAAATHFAKADDNVDDKAGVSAHAPIAVPVAAPKRSRAATVVHHRMPIGSSDEAQVLREREAWLRSLDRKYGITR
jgi:hypothetical protein